jgi:2-amino-4-hydroxy-6-hydroxymethyldihydropteridine diphosphokinase
LDSAPVVVAYVGLGSNLGDREATIRSALAVLAALPGVDALRASTLRETAPWGDACLGQPPYLNGVAEIRTRLSPGDLLDALLRVEARFGRTRGGRWAPRTLDLDLLLYGDRVLRGPDVEVPHPRMASRRFVLEPLVELAPQLLMPNGVAVKSLLFALPPDIPA